LPSTGYLQSLGFALRRQVPEFHEESKDMGADQSTVDVEAPVTVGMLCSTEEKAVTGGNELVLESFLPPQESSFARHKWRRNTSEKGGH